ncbi:hypothetical protein [Synechococcus sp. CS-205]|jgi:hypothetical protein|uniref:hypothetical protein n=1 Tax=Synechococcus sp. CS-205 TaxID=2847984 RepID=UPI00223BEF25|nr:hypothetical protein [Synechococcus sp. CS-205]MCT0248441.1 hypothetical protein [Synechococcus sp. CS-205]
MAWLLPWGRGLAAAVLLSLVGLAPARSGSVSADSVWDKGNALQRARQLVPRGAVPGRHRCQEMTVGMGNYRYRCTVEYSQPEPRQPLQADDPQPSP